MGWKMDSEGSWAFRTKGGSMISTVVFGALFAISELVALIPSVKSNSVFQLVVDALKKLAGK